MKLKLYTIPVLVLFFAALAYLNSSSGEKVPTLDCAGHTPASFSCYATYYRGIVASLGAPAAIADLKSRAGNDAYTKKECHLLMHEIGRGVARNVPSIGEAFAQGNSFCATGYFHGVMEGLMQGHGTKELSSEFLNSLCGSFRIPAKVLGAEHQDCAHGLGHGIMSLYNNELFAALETCDLLRNVHEQRFCWGGVFMENVITDFRDHTTKYLNFDDPMYPCNTVNEIYRGACYAYQSSHILKLTKSFEKTFAACREIPDEYQDACLQSIGRDATAELVQEDAARTRENCLVGIGSREQENCVIGALRYIMSNHQSEAEGYAFCSLLQENLQTACLGAAASYSKMLTPLK